METLYGGIEAGGTKFHCMVASGPQNIVARELIATTDPEPTLAQVARFFGKFKIRACGLACFGPVVVDAASRDHGLITNTPKLAWKNFNILSSLRARLGVPMAFHTDVIGAAMAEQRWGAGIGHHGVLYITIGTGIGGGFVMNGRAPAAALHSEMGHIYIPREAGDSFAGVCPYHGACLEGLASGPALAARAGVARAQDLDPNHPAWEIEAGTLARAIVNYIFTLAPDVIILGGGVMHAPGLLEKIRSKVILLTGDYGEFGKLANRMDHYLLAPALGDDAGALGAISLAMNL